MCASMNASSCITMCTFMCIFVWNDGYTYHLFYRYNSDKRVFR